MVGNDKLCNTSRSGGMNSSFMLRMIDGWKFLLGKRFRVRERHPLLQKSKFMFHSREAPADGGMAEFQDAEQMACSFRRLSHAVSDEAKQRGKQVNMAWVPTIRKADG